MGLGVRVLTFQAKHVGQKNDRMTKKRKVNQEKEIEVIMVSVMCIGVFVLIISILDLGGESQNLSGRMTNTILEDLTADGNLTDDEVENLMGLSCDELKRQFGTDKNICIYFKDSKGNIIDITKDGSFGIGCPGFTIEGQKICSIDN